MEYKTFSSEQTKQLAKRFAKKSAFKVFALIGELGSGKTTFVQGFAKGLGVKEKVISPTFILIRQHPFSKGILYHIDLYRLEGKKQLKDLGLYEIINNPKNLVLIEWAEKVKKLLPKNTCWVFLEIIDQNTRKITINP